MGNYFKRRLRFPIFNYILINMVLNKYILSPNTEFLPHNLIVKRRFAARLKPYYTDFLLIKSFIVWCAKIHVSIKTFWYILLNTFVSVINEKNPVFNQLLIYAHFNQIYQSVLRIKNVINFCNFITVNKLRLYNKIRIIKRMIII